MKGILKRGLALLLAVTIACGSFNGLSLKVEAEEMEVETLSGNAVSEEVFTGSGKLEVDIDTSELPDNEELYAGYVESLFYSDLYGDISAYANVGASKLQGMEKQAYDEMKAAIEKIAAGQETSTIVTLGEEISWTWTEEELGKEITEENIQTLAAEKFADVFDWEKIVDYLLLDCPYDFYWYDKTAQTALSYRIGVAGDLSYLSVQNVTLEFPVAVIFQNGDTYTFDTSYATSAAAAKANAQAIVSKYESKTNYEKLLGFKNEICALVSYNDEAADSSNNTAYGNPWQMIWVFDEDETTEVVCEGYSKAFQYLCDMSGLTCYTVTGKMNGENHMWNIVTLDGNNYLVDVTNCDENTIGEGTGLFLVGTVGSCDMGYTFTLSKDVAYVYDSDQVSLLGADTLILAEASYDPDYDVPGEITEPDDSLSDNDIEGVPVPSLSLYSEYDYEEEVYNLSGIRAENNASQGGTIYFGLIQEGDNATQDYFSYDYVSADDTEGVVVGFKNVSSFISNNYFEETGTYYLTAWFVGDDNQESDIVVFENYPISFTTGILDEPVSIDIGSATGNLYFSDFLFEDDLDVSVELGIDVESGLVGLGLGERYGTYYLDKNVADQYTADDGEWCFTKLFARRTTVTEAQCTIICEVADSFIAGTFEEPRVAAPGLDLVKDDAGNVTGISITNNHTEYIWIYEGLLAEGETSLGANYRDYWYVGPGEQCTISIASLMFEAKDAGTYYFAAYTDSTEECLVSETTILDYPIVIEETLLGETAISVGIGDATGRCYFTDYTVTDNSYARVILDTEKNGICDGGFGTKAGYYYTSKETSECFTDYNDLKTFMYETWIPSDTQLTVNRVVAESFEFSTYTEEQLPVPTLELAKDAEGNAIGINITNNMSEGIGGVCLRWFSEEGAIDVWENSIPNGTTKTLLFEDLEFYNVGNYTTLKAYTFGISETEAVDSEYVTLDYALNITEQEYAGETLQVQYDNDAGYVQYLYFPTDQFSVDKQIYRVEYDFRNEFGDVWADCQIEDEPDVTSDGAKRYYRMYHDLVELFVTDIYYDEVTSSEDALSILKTHVPEGKIECVKYEKEAAPAPLFQFYKDENGQIKGIYIQNQAAEEMNIEYGLVEDINATELGGSISERIEGKDACEVEFEDLLDAISAEEGTYYLAAFCEGNQRYGSSELIVLNDYQILVADEVNTDDISLMIGDLSGDYFFVGCNAEEYAQAEASIGVKYAETDEEYDYNPSLTLNKKWGMFYIYSDAFETDFWDVLELHLWKENYGTDAVTITHTMKANVPKSGIYEEPRAEKPGIELYTENGEIKGLIITNHMTHDNGYVALKLFSETEDVEETIWRQMMDAGEVRTVLFDELQLDSLEDITYDVHCQFVCKAWDYDIKAGSVNVVLDYPIQVVRSTYSDKNITVTSENVSSNIYVYHIEKADLPKNAIAQKVWYTYETENGIRKTNTKLKSTGDASKWYFNVRLDEENLAVTKLEYTEMTALETGATLNITTIPEEYFLMESGETEKRNVLFIDYDYYQAFIASGGTITFNGAEAELSTENFKDKDNLWVLEYLKYEFSGTKIYNFFKNVTSLFAESANKYWDKFSLKGIFATDYETEISGQHIAEYVIPGSTLSGNNLTNPTVYSKNIVLVKYEPEIVWVDSIHLDAPETINVGESAFVKATPDAGQDKYPFKATPEIRFESSDPEIAEIDSKTGEITGKADGKVTITVYADETMRAEQGIEEIVTAEVEIQIVLEVDEEAPTVTQLFPSDGSYLAGEHVFGLLSEDNVAVVKAEIYYSVDEGDSWILLARSTDGTFNKTIDTSMFPDGKLLVKGLAYDEKENVSEALIYQYHVDNTGPDQIQGFGAEATPVTVTLRWKDVEAEDIAYFVVEEKNAEGNFAEIQKIYATLGANIYNLTPGTTHTYRVVGYDKYGNRGVESEEITITTMNDDMAPVVSQLSPTTPYHKDTINVSATANDTYNIVKMTLQVSHNGGDWVDVCTESYTDISTTRTLNTTLQLADYEEGYLIYRAVAEDTAGNISDTSKDAPCVQYMVDRTAPKAPWNIEAKAAEGYIEISWNNGYEKDLGTYAVYRAEESENQNYELVKGNLTTLNYIDRNVEGDKTYSYVVTVNDLSGNESDYSESVSAAAIPDTVKPEILSISPLGEVLGPDYATIGIAVQDNRALASVKVEYSIDNVNYETLMERTDLSVSSIVLTNALPMKNFNDGDVIYIRASVADQAGFEGDQMTAQYTVDKTSPTVTGATAEYADEAVSISWTGGKEADLAGYRIYRSSGATENYSLLKQYAVVENQDNYSYIDTQLGKTSAAYTYKVEAADKYGNTYSITTNSVEVPGVTPVSKVNLPEAIFGCDPTFEVGVDYIFDASFSTDSEGIAAYHFDFGDGQISTAKKAIHRFAKTGEYTVTLTVTDTDGNTDSFSRVVNVTEKTFLGTAKVKVVDGNGVPVPGAYVYFDLAGENEVVKRTDGSGYASFSAEAGTHTVGSIIPNNEWLPTKKEIVVYAEETTEVTLTMVELPMVEGIFETKRMTFEEIKAAGIDVTDPANQYMVYIHLKLTYGTEEVEVPVIYNETTKEIVSEPVEMEDRVMIPFTFPQYDGHPNKTGGSSAPGAGGGDDGGGSTAGRDYEYSEELAIALLDIPIQASTLKEFFDVRLHIINNASEDFSMLENEIELLIPDGLGLVKCGASAPAHVSIDEIKGQTTHSITWILRGDEVGNHYISAEYSGVLSEFNVPIHTYFKAQDPIEVYGLSNMKLTIEIPSELDHGTLYYNVMLENRGRIDVYRPEISTEDELLETQVFDEAATRILYGNTGDAKNLSDQKVGTSINGILDVLPAGWSIVKHYMAVDQTTYTDKIMSLKDYAYEVSNTYGLEIEIVEKPLRYFKSNLDVTINAEEKAEATLNEKQGNYEYLVNNSNFIFWNLFEMSTKEEGELSELLISDSAADLYNVLQIVNGDNSFDELFTGDEKIVSEIILDAMQIAVEADESSRIKTAKVWIKAALDWVEKEILDGEDGILEQMIMDWLEEQPGNIAEQVGCSIEETVDHYAHALKSTLHYIEEERIDMVVHAIKFGNSEKLGKLIGDNWEAKLYEGYPYYEEYIKGTGYVTELSELHDRLTRAESYKKVYEAVGTFNDFGNWANDVMQKTSADLSVILQAQSNLTSCNLFLETLINNVKNTADGKCVKEAAQSIHDLLNKDHVIIINVIGYMLQPAISSGLKNQSEKLMEEVDVCPSFIVEAVKATIGIVVNIGNNVFNMNDRVKMSDKIRFASIISEAVAQGTVHANEQYVTNKDNAATYMQLIGYLIETRRIGESLTAQYGIAHEGGLLPNDPNGKKLFEAVTKKSSATHVDNWIDWRDYIEDKISKVKADLLKNPISTDAADIYAPTVMYNYATCSTDRIFSSDYEYSLDEGKTWITCNGKAIFVGPDENMRTLKVRRVDTTDTNEKRTASVNINGIPSIVNSGIEVYETENGYRFENLNPGRSYEFEFSDNRTSYKYENTLKHQIPKGNKTYTFETNQRFNYAFIRSEASERRYASYIYCIDDIYTMKSIDVTVEGHGAVTGAGNYEHGSEVTLLAQPKTYYKLEGWYQNGELVSNAISLVFDAFESKELTAKFVFDAENMVWVESIDVEAAEQIEIRDKTTVVAIPNAAEGKAFVVTPELRFESSDPSIAKIDAQTGEVIGLKRGNVTITIYADETIRKEQGMNNIVIAQVTMEIGHDCVAEYTVTKATTSENGEILGTCKKCGEELSREVIYKASKIELSETDYTYNGSPKTPEVVVKDSRGNVLEESIDYTLTYADGRTDVGSYDVTVEFIGNYDGVITENYEISAKKLTSSMISPIPEQAYSGRTIKPELEVTNDSHILTLGSDYAATYKNNVKAGTATVTITAKGSNYTGSASATFRINPISIEGASVGAIAKQTYTGKALKPKVVVKNGSKILVNGTDYTVSYSNNTNPGKATVKITGKGNYKGSITKTFNIVPKQSTLKSVTSTDIGSLIVKWTMDTKVSGYILQYSTNSSFTSTTTETITVSKYSTISQIISGLKEGKTYYVRVAGYKTIDGEKQLGKYSSISNAKVKSGFTVNAISNKVYTGNALKPTVKVTCGSTTLRSGTDYTVSYTNNTNPGKATVKVTGKGNYAGTVTVTFKIVPKKATLKTVTSTATKTLTAKWTKDSKVSGYVLQYSTSRSFTGSTTKTLYISGSSNVSKQITGLTKGKTYYVRVAGYKTIDGTKQLGSYSTLKSVKVK